ncbi:MAG: 50S ribosomal protein L25 [Eubacteriales bacterium]|nr:50S ribosomal protein L25 [Eubacteriales bacterium]
MANVILNAEKRTEMGGRVLKRLRSKGSVPAVLYGRKIEPLPLTLRYSDIREILTKEGKSAFLKLKVVDGQEYAAIVKDLQYDILNGNLMHIDLQQVSLTEKIQVEVPLRITGRELIEKGGLIVNQQVNNVTVECLPQDTPHFFEVDITGMKLGDVIKAGVIQIPEGSTLVNDPEEVLVSLLEVRHDEPEESTEEPATEGAAESAE